MGFEKRKHWMNVVLGEIGYLLNVMTRYSIQNDSFERAFCLGFFSCALSAVLNFEGQLSVNGRMFKWHFDFAMKEKQLLRHDTALC